MSGSGKERWAASLSTEMADFVDKWAKK